MKFWSLFRPVSRWTSLLIIAVSLKSTAEGPPDPAGSAELPRPGQSLIIFLVDNSASLPPLDPGEKRRVALEKMFGFLEGQPYRLVLFGGRQEVYLDSPEKYRNTGQWTDFYFAVTKVKELVATYPEGTDFKLVLVTDGVLDPSPEDWRDQEVPEGAQLTQLAAERTVAVLKEMGLPLYIILVGDQVLSAAVEEMVRAANGPMAGSKYAQGLSEFFKEDGLLFRRFVYRVRPAEGLKQIEPALRRIATPARPEVEFSISGALLLLVAVLIGVGVRSFPGPGDREILELRSGQPVHVAADRLRRLASSLPAWSWRGLSAVESAKEASATLTLLEPSQDFSPDGLDLAGLDPISRELIHLSLPALRQKLEEHQKSGSREDMIYALNLDYIARNFSPARAERLLGSPPSQRMKEDPLDFLRAKMHLLYDDALFRKLTGLRVSCMVYGPGAEKHELRPASLVKIGRYTFVVEELAKGGRKDARLVLSYQRVPSPLWLKRIVPSALQQALRFRRSHERVVA